MTATLAVPHVHDTRKGEDLMSAVREAGAFVLNRSLEVTLAVTALHRHFEIPEGKALLDRVNVTAEAITTGLVPVAEATSHQAALWGFTPRGLQVPLAWSDGGHVDDRLTAAVDEFGAFLADAKLTTVLAVLPRRTPFPVGPGKILFEKTNVLTRTQVTTLVTRDRVSDDQEAVWYFELGDSPRTRGSIRPEDVVPVAMRGCGDPGCP